MNRRSLLIGSVLALAAPLRAAAGTALLPLWPGQPPGSGGPAGPIKTSSKGAVSNIAIPNLEMIIPAQPDGAAVLIAAGGGYKRIELASEARPAASWLADRGITAFVLSYRLPLEGWNSGPLAPLQDAQRALRLIRAQADRYGLNTSRIGVLGFSAGAHLLGLAAARSAFQSYDALDDIDAQPARADTAALIYPIITLEPPYGHTSARRVLIGSHPTPQASAEWSVETHVGSNCPPVFLVQADDDPVSDPQNIIIMADACRHAGVSVEVHQLQTGGHGFGMGRPATPTAVWPSWYQTWLRSNGMLKQSDSR
jgi:acetyl esterase/lipase